MTAVTVTFGCPEITCRASFPTVALRESHYMAEHYREATSAPADLLDDDEVALPAPRGGGATMPEEHACDEPGCARTFGTIQGVTMHRTRAHRGKGHTGAPMKRETEGAVEGDARESTVHIELTLEEAAALVEDPTDYPLDIERLGDVIEDASAVLPRLSALRKISGVLG